MNIERLILRIKYYYFIAKAKKLDNLSIKVGIGGVILGLVFSIDIINYIFAWFILFGVCIKLYDFTEKIERDIVPYDFNSLLTAPPPKEKK